MSKKSLFTLAIVIALGLAGCGKAETTAEVKDEPAVTTETTNEATLAPTEEVKEEPNDEPAAEASDEKEQGITTIEITWDNATVEYTGDPYEYDTASGQVVGLHTHYEGDPITLVDTTDEGTIHKEKYEITDSEKYVLVLVEPDAPVNNCPIDTVSVKITHPDGTVEEPSYEESYSRGQTGIWYYFVYEQGSDQ